MDRAETGDVELVMSDDAFNEISDVLNRSSVQRKFRTLTPQRVGDTLARIQRITVLLTNIPEAFSLTRDPRDSMYLNLAIAADAELVVSRDNDLLDLMTANDADSIAFRTNFPTIRVLDPVAFLQLHLVRVHVPVHPPVGSNEGRWLPEVLTVLTDSSGD